MIKKVSVFLNISAMAVSAYCLFFLVGRVGSYDQGTNRIKSIEKETKEILAKLEEFKKEHALKYSSERSKNQRLEEAKFESEKNLSEQTRLLAKTKEDLNNLEETKIALEKEIVDAKLKLNTETKNISKMESESLRAVQNIPLIERSKTEALSNIQNLEMESKLLSEKIEVSARETDILEKHYDATIDALYNDKSSQNWLKKGDILKVSVLAVDIQSGFLGLLAGKEQGLYEEKLFAVYDQGTEICKLKIVRSELDKSVGAIVPLLGEPVKLLQLNEIDLHHL